MIAGYTSTPAKDQFMFTFIVTYLSVMKKFSDESMSNFTAYDFINLDNQRYWNLNSFETEILNIYFRLIRCNWLKNTNNEDLTVYVKSPCRQYVSVTGKFFVNQNGGTHWEVDLTIADDLMNQNMLPLTKMMTSKTTRPRRTSTSMSTSVMQMVNSLSIKESVHERCMLQQWNDVDVKEMCPGGRGRGLIASRRFLKNDILVDYHARVITQNEKEDIMTADDSRMNYLFCAPGLVWDGSAEWCSCHPQSRLLGRLVNFAKKSTVECNARPQLFEFKHSKSSVFNAIILVATRDIEPLEELRFDYGDNACLELFK